MKKVIMHSTLLIMNWRIGGLAQLARASALHAEGQRFESVILHSDTATEQACVLSNDLWHDVQKKVNLVRAKSIYRTIWFRSFLRKGDEPGDKRK